MARATSKKPKREDLEPIESTAPNRVFVEATPVKTSSDQANEPAGLALIRKSDCFNCHAVNRPLVGPTFVEVANKYRDQPHQLDLSITRSDAGFNGCLGEGRDVAAFATYSRTGSANGGVGLLGKS